MAKWLVSGMGVLALVTATAACGSSSSEQGTNSPATTVAGTGSSGSPGSASSTAKGTPVKVGLICSCTGPIGADAAADGDVGKAWAASTNALGGVNGHPIDLITFDDGSNPGNSVTDAQTLISDHVAAIIDDSLEDPTWANTVAGAKIPVIAGITDSINFNTNPDFFPSGQTLDSLFYSQVAMAKQAGATNFGVLYCAESPTCAEEPPAMKTAGKTLGVPEIYSAAVSATAPNYTAQCLAAEQKKVTAIAFEEQAPTFISTGKDCSQQGYNPIWLAPAAAYYSTVGTSPGIEKNLWVEFGDVPYFSNAPEVQVMNAAVDKYFPGIRQNKGGVIWNQSNIQSWTGGLLIRDAIKGSGVASSGTVNAAAMTQGLNSIKNDTLDGWSSPLTFTAGKPHPVDCWFTAHIVNGTPTVSNNGKPICESSAAS